MKWVDRRNKDKKRRGGVVKGGGGNGPIAKQQPYNSGPAEQPKPYTERIPLSVGNIYKMEIACLTETGNATAYYCGNRVIIRTNGSRVGRSNLVDVRVVQDRPYYVADLLRIIQLAQDSRMDAPVY